MLVCKPSDIDVDCYIVTSSPQTDVGCYVIITYWRTCYIITHWCSCYVFITHWCSFLRHHIRM